MKSAKGHWIPVLAIKKQLALLVPPHSPTAWCQCPGTRSMAHGWRYLHWQQGINKLVQRARTAPFRRWTCLSHAAALSLRPARQSTPGPATRVLPEQGEVSSNSKAWFSIFLPYRSHSTGPSLCFTTTLRGLMPQSILNCKHWSQQTWINAEHGLIQFSSSICMWRSPDPPPVTRGSALAVHQALGLTSQCWAGHEALSPCSVRSRAVNCVYHIGLSSSLVHSRGENLLPLSHPWIHMKTMSSTSRHTAQTGAKRGWRRSDTAFPFSHQLQGWLLSQLNGKLVPGLLPADEFNWIHLGAVHLRKAVSPSMVVSCPVGMGCCERTAEVAEPLVCL